MNDKLFELHQLARDNQIPLLAAPRDEVVCTGEELGAQFRQWQDRAQMILAKVKLNNEEILNLRREEANTSVPQREKAILQELDRINAENGEYLRAVKELIEKMGEDIEATKKQKGGEPEARIKANVQKSLASKLQVVMRDNQEALSSVKTEIKDKIKRQIRIMDEHLPPEQVEQLAQNPETVQKMMAERVFKTPHAKLMNMFRDIQEKHEEILKLERSVENVHQLFRDLALLVQEQGEYLDSIEHNVTNTNYLVRKAEVQLKDAKTNYQSSRKKKCCIIFVVLCVILGILYLSLIHI
eukprot:TRINITY_DN12585_c0_g4_i4.p2 TRINITY_DN12585_c0_g4~~TRINITY_DN12585_c0_g4_i4.p2  ORF type:complete len:298 (-),score=69.15 TRINITY_DN12585_c0_g4_i4:1-894(-)